MIAKRSQRSQLPLRQRWFWDLAERLKPEDDANGALATWEAWNTEILPDFAVFPYAIHHREMWNWADSATLQQQNIT